MIDPQILQDRSARITKSFDNACRFLGRHGIDRSNIRLKAYTDFIANVQSGQAKDLYDPIDFVRLWREFHEVIFVLNVLEDNQLNVPDDLIANAFSGHPIGENDPEKDRSRNYMLQMRAAIYFLRLGYDIKLDQECDVIAERRRERYYVECKCLYSPKKVCDRIGEGFKQLINRLDSPRERTKSRGVLWVDPSAIMLRECFCYTAFSREGARQAVRYDLSEFWKRFVLSCDQPTDKRLFAIILQLVWPSYSGSEGGVVTGFTSVIVPARANAGFFDLIRIRRHLGQLFEIEEI